MSTSPQRPPQVTSACLFIGLSSALLLVNLVQILTSWNSLGVQEALGDAFDSAGVALTDGRSQAIHVALQVVVVLLVAGLVCAVYATRRHAPSRIVVTAVAALTALVFLLIGGLIGLIPAAFAGYAVFQLWSPPSRRWFAGLDPVASAPRATPAADPFADPFAGRGAPPASGVAQATLPPPPIAPPPPVEGPGRAPSPVRTIDLVVSITAAVTAVGSAMYLAVYLLARDSLVQAQLDSPFRSMLEASDDEIVQAMRTTAALCAVSLVLSVAALVAVRVLVRRGRPAHLALTVLSGVTVGVGVLTIVGIPWAALAVWVLVLLRRPETRAWIGDPGH